MFYKQITICFLCLFTSLITEAASPNAFVLRGNVKKVKGCNIEKVYLRSVFDSQLIDSSSVVNGEYEFRGCVNASLFVILSCEPFTATDSIGSAIVQGKMWRKFLIEPTQISVISRSDFGNIKIKGLKLNAEWESCVTTNRRQNEAVRYEVINKINESEPVNFETYFQNLIFGFCPNKLQVNQTASLCFSQFIENPYVFFLGR